MDIYKTKYRFQWWWYSKGGKETFENVTGTIMIFCGIYAAWTLAYLLEP